jgi:hypothetical protein
MHSPSSAAAVLLFLTALSAAAAPAAESDLHELIAGGHYPEAMQKITAALALKGPAAQAVDRCDLYLMKAECHLQLRALPLAISAYDHAAQEAALQADERRHALALAHIALLRASKAFTYTPKTTPDHANTPPDKTRPKPIDLFDPAHRRQAFAALFLDQLAALEPQLKAARAATSLPPIAACIKALDELEALERAASEDGTETQKVTILRKALTEHVQKLLADAFRTLSARIGDIDKEAGTYVEFYEEAIDPFNTAPQFRRRKAWKKKGLTPADTKTLEAATQTCDQVALALPQLATGLKQEEKTFAPAEAEAGRLRKEVERILDTDYLKVYHTPPK